MSVTVRTPVEGERRRLDPLSSVSVGRCGDVRIGVGKNEDEYLHGVAFWVADRGGTWEVSVPERNHLEVESVCLDDRVARTIQPGTSTELSWPAAEVMVRTYVAEHRIVVTMEPGICIVGDVRTGTTEPVRLSATDVNDRVLIVACADRVRRPGAAPLSRLAISNALASAGYDTTPTGTIGQQLKRASIKAAVAVEDHPSWMGWPDSAVSLSVLVDFLVATGSVTAELLGDVLGGPVRR